MIGIFLCALWVCWVSASDTLIEGSVGYSSLDTELPDTFGSIAWVDNDGDAAYLFGGCLYGAVSPTSCLTTLYSADCAESAVWSPINITLLNDVDARVFEPAYAMADYSRSMYIFGGVRVTNKELGTTAYSNTLSVISPEDGGWVFQDIITGGETPTAVSDAALAVYGQEKNGLVLFGGYDGSNYQSDLFTISHSCSWDWVKRSVEGDIPSARRGHTMTVITIKGESRVFLFGGVGADGVYGDLYSAPLPAELSCDSTTDPIVWTQISSSDTPGWYAPSPRAFHAALPMKAGDLVIFGGCAYQDSPCYNDVHFFDAVNSEWIVPAMSASFVNATWPSEVSDRPLARKRLAYALVPDDEWRDVYQAHPDYAGYFLTKMMIFGGVAEDRVDSALYILDVNLPAEDVCVNGDLVGDVCECYGGWSGKFCEFESNCENDCSSVEQGYCTLDANDDTSFCTCHDGYWSDACEYESCPNNCNGRGTCKATGETDPHLTTAYLTYCECTEGWSGDDCAYWDGNSSSADLTTCLNDCSGQGVCTEGLCICNDGYNGADCSVSCPEQCSSHGVCLDTGLCECDEGYTGLDCAQSYCGDNNCTGHGVCVEDTCYCDTDWVGAFCEADVSCGGHGLFIDEACVCDDGYGGYPDCSQEIVCSPTDCSGHGSCEDSGLVMEGSVVDGICICLSGYSGSGCEIMNCPADCSGNGECDESSGVCDCYAGYEGDDCADVNPCPNNCTSAAHGTCVGNATCHCNIGWTGSDCSEYGCEDDCSGNGQCYSGQCDCDEGFTGAACDVSCSDLCHGQGTCFNMTCFCDPSYGGEYCETAKACSGDSLCNSDGVCFTPYEECQCRSGYGGAECDEYESGCGVAGCNDHGTCLNGTCFCDYGYLGDNCSVTDVCEAGCDAEHGLCYLGVCHCDKGFEGDDCSNVSNSNATCTEECLMGTCLHGACMCVTGWEGPACDVETSFCGDEDPCVYGSCNFGRCWCAEGFSGELCDVAQGDCSDCDTSKGQCINGICSCLPGFTGEGCQDIAECPTSLDVEGLGACSGRGVCTFGVCACVSGYTGEACEQLDLDTALSCPDDCSTNGVCHLGQCFCLPGISGANCNETEPWVCAFDCYGRGSCTAGQCHCDPGYTGAACQEDAVCSQECYQHGVCAFGKCLCVAGWSGEHCSEYLGDGPRRDLLRDDLLAAVKNEAASAGACADACNMHGICGDADTCLCDTADYNCSDAQDQMLNECEECVNGECFFGECYCHAGFTGPACDVYLSAECPDNCNGHGVCYHGQCHCEEHYGEENCVHTLICDHLCGSHGVCLNGACVCSAGYTGEFCTEVTGSEAEPAWDDYQVLGFREKAHTIVAPTQAVTLMEEDIEGECEPACVNGVCHARTCYCKAGFTGSLCESSIADALLSQDPGIMALNDKSNVKPSISPEASTLGSAAASPHPATNNQDTSARGMLAVRMGESPYYLVVPLTAFFGGMLLTALLQKGVQGIRK